MPRDEKMTDEEKISELKKRNKNLLENAKIMIEEYNELEKECDFWKEQIIKLTNKSWDDLEKEFREFKERSQANGSKI